jgi:FkbM family methyltransferase
MEHRFGWRGICVEPIPLVFQRLRQCRPRSHCFQVAAADRNSRDVDDVVTFTVSNAMDGMLSGISHCIDAHTHHVQGCPQIQVKLRTVTSLLDECRAPPFIEYMSIDTEGSELLVLHGIDWQRYRFGMISVEHNNVQPRRTQMRQLLERNGYRWLRENHWDDDYVICC